MTVEGRRIQSRVWYVSGWNTWAQRGADFYGKTPDELRLEFKKSLKVFLDVCKEKGIEPYKEYSGKFNLRIPPELHAEIASMASADGKSLNQWVVETLDQIVHAN